MLNLNDVHALASRPERAVNSVLTIYLDVDQSRQANLNRGFENQLKDMLAGLKDTIHDDVEKKTFESASKRATEFAAKFDVNTRGLVMAFDASDGFFWSRDIDLALTNQIRWDKEVFVEPLAAAIDEYERVGIVLLDRANLRLFTMFLGKVKEHIREEFDHRKVRHTRTVGTDHLGSASHAQRKADEQIRWNLRRIAKDVERVVAVEGLRRLILAGSSEITAELKSLLPKRLATRVIGTVDVATTANVEEIRLAAEPIAQKFEHESESGLVNDLVTSAAKAGPVVIGLGHTLQALNQNRVWHLMYADGFHCPGYECSKCAALFSIKTNACPTCGTKVTRVTDVVQRAVDHAIRRGVPVEVIRAEEPESLLMNTGGIGAFLRTRSRNAREG